MELGVKSEELRVKIIFQSSPKVIPSLHTPNFALRLDKHPEIRYNRLAIGVWRSLVSRLVRVQEASGSNPDTPTKKPESAFAGSGLFMCYSSVSTQLSSQRRCSVMKDASTLCPESTG